MWQSYGKPMDTCLKRIMCQRTLTSKRRSYIPHVEAYKRRERDKVQI